MTWRLSRHYHSFHSLGPSDAHTPEGRTDGREEKEEDREAKAGSAEGEAEDGQAPSVAVNLLREKRTARRIAGPFRFSRVPHESLRPSELREVARALEPELSGAVVQKVRAPWPERLELDLRQPGRTVRLLLSVESGLGRLSVIDARTLSSQDTGPSPWLLRARKELTGRRLSAIRSTGPAQVRLSFEKGGSSRSIVADLGSTHVPLRPGEHMVDAGANPAIVLGHPKPAPDA